jgi:hypothetical protein
VRIVPSIEESKMAGLANLSENVTFYHFIEIALEDLRKNVITFLVIGIYVMAVIVTLSVHDRSQLATFRTLLDYTKTVSTEFCLKIDFVNVTAVDLV